MAPTKIRFDLSEVPYRDELPDELAGETLWADPVGEDCFRLRNSPAYARGFAEGDVVECEPNATTGAYQVTRLARDSGNGTIRVYLTEDVTRRQSGAFSTPCGLPGAPTQRGSDWLVTFVVPPTITVSLQELSALLNEAAVVEAWEFGKEPTFGEPAVRH